MNKQLLIVLIVVAGLLIFSYYKPQASIPPDAQFVGVSSSGACSVYTCNNDYCTAVWYKYDEGSCSREADCMYGTNLYTKGETIPAYWGCPNPTNIDSRCVCKYKIMVTTIPTTVPTTSPTTIPTTEPTTTPTTTPETTTTIPIPPLPDWLTRLVIYLNNLINMIRGWLKL